MSDKPVRRRKTQPKKTLDRAQRRLRAIQEALSLIDPTRRAAVERKAAQIPLKYRLGYVRAAAGIASPRQVIKVRCLECTGYEPDEIRRCTLCECECFLYRPYQEEVADDQ
jgi:hypothetical protein